MAKDVAQLKPLQTRQDERLLSTHFKASQNVGGGVTHTPEAVLPTLTVWLQFR